MTPDLQAQILRDLMWVLRVSVAIGVLVASGVAVVRAYRNGAGR